MPLPAARPRGPCVGGRWSLVFPALVFAACASAATSGSGTLPETFTDSIARLPGAAVERDTTPLLDGERIAALPLPDRQAWTRYLEQSRAARESDMALIQAELRALGRDRMSRAPYGKAFVVTKAMTPEWFRTDSARVLADNILSYQTPSGGWSKRVDFELRPRQPGESFYSESDGWHYIATLDNDGTTEPLRFLAAAYQAHGDVRYRDAFLRGLQYLYAAQFPTGCWPQVYPLQGGYHDAVTFNDEATVNALRLLRDVAWGRFEFVPEPARARAAEALARGVDCLVASQVVVNGVRTGWGQQHDPLTLAPTSGRSYELAGLSGRESAEITEFLMSLRSPGDAVVEAVHAAVDWFERTVIRGHTYGSDQVLRAEPDGGPLWARLLEIETGRPIFANRDGVKLYDWNQLTDRRQGYGWFSTEPAAVLEKYAEWAQKYPRRIGSD